MKQTVRKVMIDIFEYVVYAQIAVGIIIAWVAGFTHIFSAWYSTGIGFAILFGGTIVSIASGGMFLTIVGIYHNTKLDKQQD